jgi:8-oxo-dGTP diphosphatase
MIHVAAAVIINDHGQVLVTRRAEQTHQGGLWEFPGGKLEPNEHPEAALCRELQEELGILPVEYEPLIRIRHAYDDRMVLLDFYRVTAYQGEAKGLEGQPMRWLRPEEMQPETFPEADRPVIMALQLPRHYMITGVDPKVPSAFLQTLSKAITQGIRLVQLRAHQLSDRDYRQILSEAVPLCRSRGVKLLLNRVEGILDWHGEADGLHLTARSLNSLSQRPALEGLLGASCHCLDELKKAEHLGLDYALLSPVRPTSSHPHASCLGWDNFAAWVDQVNLPVYALGGMVRIDLPKAISNGAQGIAGISTFWDQSLNP